MKKKYRVKKNEEFVEIMNFKRFYVSSSFTIYIRPRKYEFSRIGLSVGKKLGKANIRNKIKRQVRMMCQELYNFEEKYDTIILVRPGYLNENYETNKKMLESLRKKAKI